MQCPLCHKSLYAIENDCYVCPGDDGVLLTGKHLAQKSITLAKEITTDIGSVPINSSARRQISCPHCASLMQTTDYDSIGVLIDSCPRCKYRWLDRGEYDKIVSFVPRINPEDRLFLMSIDQKIQQLSSATDSPSAQLADSLNADAMLKTRGAGRGSVGLLVGTAVQGLWKLAVRYPAARVISALLIIGIIAGYWYVTEHLKTFLQYFPG